MIIPALFLPDAEQFNKLSRKLVVGSIAQRKSVLPSLCFCLPKISFYSPQNHATWKAENYVVALTFLTLR